MIITQKQLVVLFDIAKWAATNLNGHCPVTQETIQTLVNQIYNQQSDKLVEVK